MIEINIILSKNNIEKIKSEINKNNYTNTYVFSSPEIFLNKLEKFKYEKIFIIGGASIYNYFINKGLIDRLYITKILSENIIFNCDIFFPKINIKDYSIISKSNIIIEKNCYSNSLKTQIDEIRYIFICYEKIKGL